MIFIEDFILKFSKLNFSIPFVPKIFKVKELKRNVKDVTFSHPKDYLAFLEKEKEKEFWKQHESNQFFKRYADLYSNAINYLKNANESSSSYLTYLNNSKQQIELIPNSQSLLTKELLRHKVYPQSFYEGFIDGIKNIETSYSNSSKFYHLGLFKAFQYIDTIKKLDDILPEQMECFENTQLSFINTADEYIKKYNDLFNQKENEFKEMDSEITTALNIQKEKHDEFIKQKTQDMQNLEKLYAENLRLKKPAEYWQKMNQEYENKAKKYMKYAFVTGIISVILLTLLIVYIPEATDASHWFDLIKNTAILTVITTILVYILRIFVKIAMSSYHLARDAKEREQLTYFYLSLINEKAVSDSERELIITSLFSRSDTGLLKGDASPEMPTINFSEIFSNKK